MSNFTVAVAKFVNEELERWGDGAGRETDAPYSSYVAEYWKVGLPIINRNGNTTEIGADGKSSRPPWSAAFVSYIMRKSGAGDEFLYSEAHGHYVIKAICAANTNPIIAKFIGHHPAKYKPKVGDLISAERGYARNYNFQSAQDNYGPKPVPRGHFFSHSDIVVDVDAVARTLKTVGGNVTPDTVAKKTWRLKQDGTLVQGASLICVVECLL